MVHTWGGKRPSLHESVFVAWNAEVSGDVEAGVDASIWYGATVRGDMAAIRIGARTNIQDGVILHTVVDGPCIIGEGVTVGHGGSILLDGAEIGSESIVGAGALVTQGKRYPPRSMILGSPAKVVRTLTDGEVESLRTHAVEYVELARKTSAEAGGPRPQA
jgi:carbonic anhydrase/acetyltransferase-like protein (isoleucine patch superfamily)